MESSPKEICNHIERGLLLLQQKSFNIYIPDFDWYNVHKDFGTSSLYDHLVEHPQEVASAPKVETDPAALKEIVLRFIDVEEQEFDPSVPLIGYGLDSMSASRLSVALRPYITLSQLQLLADMSLLDIHTRMETTSSVQVAVKNSASVEEMIAKYSRRLASLPPLARETPSIVLITGTTGMLGSQLMARLIESHDVVAVYALNRGASESVLERHRSRFEAMELKVGLLQSPKLTLLEGDLASHDLGLPTKLYEKVSGLPAHYT